MLKSTLMKIVRVEDWKNVSAEALKPISWKAFTYELSHLRTSALF